MRLQAIIFDMDGTIVDTNNIWEVATIDLIEKRGISLTPAQKYNLTKKTAGFGVSESCRTIKELTGITDPVEDLVQELRNHANSLYEKGISFINGFQEFHTQLQKHHIKTGIATNACSSTVDKTNNALDLTQFFGEHIYHVNHVNNLCKPNPALYLYAANKLQVNPEHCIAIEDSAHGIQAAQSAGLFCIGINTSNDMNQVQKADIIVSGYHEINVSDLIKGRQYLAAHIKHGDITHGTTA